MNKRDTWCQLCALALVLHLKLPTSSPCICTRNSVLILRAASLSFSLLEPHKESISSMKMMDGLFSRANENRFFTNLWWGTERRKTLKTVYLPTVSRSHVRQTRSFTFRFRPATWTQGRRKRWKRRWNYWLLWPPPWQGRTSLFLEDRREGSPAKESAFLHKQMHWLYLDFAFFFRKCKVDSSLLYQWTDEGI